MRCMTIAGVLAVLPWFAGCGADVASPKVVAAAPVIAPVSINNGDVNGDGSVDYKDILLAQRILLGKTVATIDQTNRGDLYADGNFDVSDFLLIQKKVMGL